jgi:protein Tex
MVNESGASIYSASKTAREEFPGYDVTVRGAVSIGRRLADPLAELVKIEPKSIGVGQYQHDVDQNKFKESLDQVVESCVNLVGVNLNTASMHLLTYVSGLGPQLAGNIVQYRKENGAFKSRAELKKVPRLGEKAFEQCAGFLRIPGAKIRLTIPRCIPKAIRSWRRWQRIWVLPLMTLSAKRNCVRR